MSSLSRRRFLQSSILFGAAGSLPGISWASSGVAGSSRLVIIILRGAMDGLAAVIPWSDANLQNRRAPLLPPEQSLLQLDRHFALHPELKTLFALHQRGELGILHAVATPYRQRSHFDGQNVLESGLEWPQSNTTGWLNRAVEHSNQQKGMAIGQSIPLLLRGAASIGSWTPPTLPPVSENTLGRLQALYSQDAFLGPRLDQALLSRNIVSMTNAENAPQSLAGLAGAAASFLTATDGPDIVVLENDGWDTHAAQGDLQGQLPRKFAELDAAIAQLQLGLGSSWQNTAVVVMTEFGRTVAVNGTLGTDHGTGGLAFVAGGSLGRSAGAATLLGDWPGLADKQLHEGRDLMPVNDMRALLKSVLHRHMGYSRAALDGEIFPGSAAVGLLDGIFQ